MVKGMVRRNRVLIGIAALAATAAVAGFGIGEDGALAFSPPVPRAKSEVLSAARPDGPGGRAGIAATPTEPSTASDGAGLTAAAGGRAPVVAGAVDDAATTAGATAPGLLAEAAARPPTGPDADVAAPGAASPDGAAPGAGSAVASTGLAPLPTRLSEAYGDWIVQCIAGGSGQPAARTCWAELTVRAPDSDQRLFHLNVPYAAPGTPQRMVVTAPFGLALERGLRFGIGAPGDLQAPFATCLQQGCSRSTRTDSARSGPATPSSFG